MGDVAAWLSTLAGRRAPKPTFGRRVWRRPASDRSGRSSSTRASRPRNTPGQLDYFKIEIGGRLQGRQASNTSRNVSRPQARQASWRRSPATRGCTSAGRRATLHAVDRRLLTRAGVEQQGEGAVALFSRRHLAGGWPILERAYAKRDTSEIKRTRFRIRRQDQGRWLRIRASSNKIRRAARRRSRPLANDRPARAVRDCSSEPAEVETSPRSPSNARNSDRIPVAARSMMPTTSSCCRFPACESKTWRRCRPWPRLAAQGDQTSLVPSFPCVTCPVQANMTTGKLPREHGVVANGFYWRDKQRSRDVDRLERVHPAAADLGHAAPARPGDHLGRVVSAAQQGLRRRPGLHARADPQSRRLANRCGATPSRRRCTARCATRWGTFRCNTFGGRWRTSSRPPGSATRPCGRREQSRPNFFYIYLPHLDYAAQKLGPDSEPPSAPWPSSTA